MTLSEHEELQAAIGQLPKTGRGRRYPRALRERVLAYASSSGQTLWQVGQSLGIPGATLSRWRKPTRKKLRRVEVVKPVTVPSMLTFTTRDVSLPRFRGHLQMRDNAQGGYPFDE